jgi:hypothetical protein
MNSNRPTRTPIENVLCLGTDDYLEPGLLGGVAGTHTPLTDQTEQRMFGFGLAIVLLTQKLIVAGDAVGPAEFRAWPGSLAEVIGRVITEWHAWPFETHGIPMTGDLMLFINTAAGNEIATCVLAGEGWFPDLERPGKWIRADGARSLPPGAYLVNGREPTYRDRSSNYRGRPAKLISRVRTPIEEVLAGGTAGPVLAADLELVADTHTLLTDPLEQRMFAIGLAIELLMQGLLEAGDFDGDAFRPWSVPVTEAIGRIATTLGTAPPVGPDHGAAGDVFWFNNTTAGNELARTIIARGS